MFGVEIEITMKIAKLKAKIFEVGIGYNGRTYSEGKKITIKDGVIADFQSSEQMIRGFIDLIQKKRSML